MTRSRVCQSDFLRPEMRYRLLNSCTACRYSAPPTRSWSCVQASSRSRLLHADVEHTTFLNSCRDKRVELQLRVLGRCVHARVLSFSEVDCKSIRTRLHSSPSPSMNLTLFP